MKNIHLLLMAMTLIFTACSTQTVQVDYDRSVNFAFYKTYQISTQNLDMDELDKTRLLTALTQELGAKGLSSATNPQLVIEIFPEEYISEKANSSVGVGVGGGNYGYGGGFGGGVSFGIPINSKQLNQDVVVHMKEGDKLIWEGIINIQMPVKASAEMREKAIQKGVQKLMKNYPPKK